MHNQKYSYSGTRVMVLQVQYYAGVCTVVVPSEANSVGTYSKG